MTRTTATCRSTVTVGNILPFTLTSHESRSAQATCISLRLLPYRSLRMEISYSSVSKISCQWTKAIIATRRDVSPSA
ncbi:hypothetical protein SERLA73DRAFT_182705 [Serpula lacrymans var. lacrymans S7.3]|uniref:Uncharacterized protein n=1 Tax=Serpula lacrymans var. lacrymans (strain S7.3) TaxID=936435 RepID=F8Q0T2_SERL3|nr:hypothetical protein SERLA73DRAFT_182705 [Serpula lacrymans var. lacrymans S7.3]